MTDNGNGAQNVSPTNRDESPAGQSVTTADRSRGAEPSDTDAATESKGCAGQGARTEDSNGTPDKPLAAAGADRRPSAEQRFDELIDGAADCMEGVAEALRERDFDVADERLGDAREKTLEARNLRDDLDEDLITDGGLLTGGHDTVDAHDLTQFQLDILTILAGDGTADEADYGLAIKRALEGYYGETVNHGRLYPNLDDLVTKGLVAKDALDNRTNTYALTEDGWYVLRGRLEWLADQAGFHLTETETAHVVNGEGGAAGGVE